MQNSISHWQRMLLQEVEEKQLSPKQQKIAKLDPPTDKIDAGDFKKLRSKKSLKKEIDTPTDYSGKPSIAGLGPIVDMEEGMDHEVSMANNSLESIVKAAMELKAKLGNNEKDIPAWIQDHITNAANFISQAADNYHEYGGEELEDDNISSIMENNFISLEDFSKNLEKYKKGDIIKSQLINSYNKLDSKDQEKAKELAKGQDVLPNPKKISEMSLQKIMEKIINESVESTLKAIKPGIRVKMILDDGSTVTMERAGSSKTGEPTFKRVDKEGKVKGGASTVSASHIKSVKPVKK